MEGFGNQGQELVLVLRADRKTMKGLKERYDVIQATRFVNDCGGRTFVEHEEYFTDTK